MIDNKITETEFLLSESSQPSCLHVCVAGSGEEETSQQTMQLQYSAEGSKDKGRPGALASDCEVKLSLKRQ